MGVRQNTAWLWIYCDSLQNATPPMRYCAKHSLPAESHQTALERHPPPTRHRVPSGTDFQWSNVPVVKRASPLLMLGLGLDSLYRIVSFASLDRLIAQYAHNYTQRLAQRRATKHNHLVLYLRSTFGSQCVHGFCQRFDAYQAFGSVRCASVEGC